MDEFSIETERWLGHIEVLALFIPKGLVKPQSFKFVGCQKFVFAVCFVCVFCMICQQT